jgi:hypothetical protein
MTTGCRAAIYQHRLHAARKELDSPFRQLADTRLRADQLNRGSRLIFGCCSFNWRLCRALAGQRKATVEKCQPSMMWFDLLGKCQLRCSMIKQVVSQAPLGKPQMLGRVSPHQRVPQLLIRILQRCRDEHHTRSADLHLEAAAVDYVPVALSPYFARNHAAVMQHNDSLLVACCHSGICSILSASVSAHRERSNNDPQQKFAANQPAHRGEE